MKPQYIKDFEELGLGLFVHFGLYSVLGNGEWYLHFHKDEKPQYFGLIDKFNVKKNWAKNLVSTAKKSGCKYITLTTRHHEGFSLYDTCGLNEFDAPHSKTHRDLVREFVDECNKQGIKPFFYHTLLDWHEPSYYEDFPKYIDYLIKSVEILCKNYGKIGGLWFDGYWDRPNANWEFDRLYQTIRKYQPEAMIINNTGTDSLGRVTHKDIDSVTFERGKPAFVNNDDGKDRAGEVCDGLSDHWGYAKNDLNVKSFKEILHDFIECRSHNCNFLINSGPMANGELNPYEKYVLLNVGKWIKVNKNFIYKCKSANIEADNATILFDGEWYYAITENISMESNEHTERPVRPVVELHTDKRITSIKFLDNGEKVPVIEKRKFSVTPCRYSTSYTARVARFKLK